MKGFIRLMIICALLGSILSCATQNVEDEDSLTTESYSSGNEMSEGQKDEFADFGSDNGGESSTEQAPAQASQDPDLAIENEIGQSDDQSKNFAADDLDQPAPEQNQPQDMAPPPTDDQLAQKPEEPPPPVPVEEAPKVAEAPPPMPEIEDPMAAVSPPAEPAPSMSDRPADEPPMNMSLAEKPANITALKYKANDAGGTVVIESSEPVTYTTRMNPDLKQFVIEIPNANLPKKLKRSLNTRDIKGAVGAVDAYQNPGSTTARIVVQMRDGYAEPVVQQEGNALLVVTAEGGAEQSVAAAEQAAPDEQESLIQGEANVNVDLNNGKILTSQSLDEFISGNTKFYGRKISIETNNMDVRDALKFITEESGVNMVIADEVKGNISLKLRQVPWDQALVVIMKARRLGYSRQGNVLRIAPIDDLRKEEDEATKIALAKRTLEPLKVRMFPISYAKVDELDKKVKEFLSERGKVVGDPRTSALVVTDTEENLNRVSKLILSLDTAPPQVLIEGKIVEASDSFSRNIGVNWGFTGGDIKIGNSSRGPVNLRPSMTSGGAVSGTGGMQFNVNVGVMDIFGDLSASLALYEKDSKVKVLSSPRIVTLSNEPANISQTNELPVRQVNTTNGQTTITYQFKPLTLKLDVVPQITSEGTIIMKVGVSRQVQGAPVSNTDQTFSVNSREANTRVIVKNGQTAVIGGIYKNDVTEGEDGVPWLKDIPLLGYMFKATSVSKERSELLIFLTPRILAQTETTPAPHSDGFGE